MLLQDQLVASVLSGAGQVFLTPSDLQYDGQRVRDDFFIPCVREYEKYRPKVVKKLINISNSGYPYPSDFIGLVSITPADYSSTSFPFSSSVSMVPRELKGFEYDDRDRVIYAASGEYTVQYFSRYTISQDVEDFQVYNLLPLQTSISLRLPCRVVPGSLVIKNNNEEALVSVDGESISGWCSGTFSYLTLDLTLNLVNRTGPVVISFRAENCLVEELSFNDIMFIDLFASRFLLGFGMTKAVMRLDNLPFDITVDNLMDYGRERETSFKEKLESQQSWWVF